jgi:hypothetical protein
MDAIQTLNSEMRIIKFTIEEQKLEIIVVIRIENLETYNEITSKITGQVLRLSAAPLKESNKRIK